MIKKSRWLQGLLGVLLASSVQAQPPELTPRQYEQLTQLSDALQEEEYQQAKDLGYALYERPRGNNEQQAFIRVYAARVLAQVYQQQDKLEAATQLLKTTLESAGEAVDPASLQTLRWLLIQTQLGQENYQEALQQLKLWWDFEEAPTTDAFYLRAALLAQLERWSESEHWILLALEQRTQPPDSWRALAVAVFQRQEKWLEAAEQQSIRLEVNPERARLWKQLAQLQKLAGQPDESLVTQELAQRRGYLNAREQEMLGRELLHSGQPLRAAQVFERLLEEPGTKTAQRLALAAQAWLQTRQPQQTALALQRVAENSQDKADWRRLADWHYSQGHWKEALSAWEQVIPRLESEAQHQVQLLMATSYIELEDYAQARQLLEELVETSKETAARQWLSYLDAL